MRLVTELSGTSVRGRMANKLIEPTMQQLRETIDPEGPGGAYMLGLRQLGVVAHGRFSARGFARAIDVAARGVQQGVIGRTRDALRQAGALRPAAGGPGPITGRSSPSAKGSALASAFGR